MLRLRCSAQVSGLVFVGADAIDPVVARPIRPASLITVKPFFGCALGMATAYVGVANSGGARLDRVRLALLGRIGLSPVLSVVHRWWVRKAIMRAVALASVVVSLGRVSSALRKVLRPSMTSMRAVACSGVSVNT